MKRRMVRSTYPARRTRMKYSPARRSRAATTIARAWRSKRGRLTGRRRVIGQSIWTGNCKSTITAQSNPTAKLTNTLWGEDLTECVLGPGQNQRERGVINCRGFKIDVHMHNTSGSFAQYANFAIVAPKRLVGSTDPLEGTNFFRGNGTLRAIDFNAVGVIPFERYVRSINPDDYTILYHARRILLPNNSAGAFNSQRGSSFWNIRKYIKLNRAITYANPESIRATDGMVGFCYWFGRMDSSDGVTAVAEVTVTERAVMYFKEPKQ